ncbi:hypothetical protein CDAR_466001 [Caerostris darwini]|uniref:Uncharacterized protein n=1 Tax=Caerostris darwini TaxID=1538125 RepID=A0AAV4WLS7_9ARAC|nr:hypothetical protein CDAR_466001 [Caerostris darwini]
MRFLRKESAFDCIPICCLNKISCISHKVRAEEREVMVCLMFAATLGVPKFKHAHYTDFIVFPRSQPTEFGPQILAQGGMKCSKRSQQLGDSGGAPALLYLLQTTRLDSFSSEVASFEHLLPP